jgi:hypothetical protein
VWLLELVSLCLKPVVESPFPGGRVLFVGETERLWRTSKTKCSWSRYEGLIRASMLSLSLILLSFSAFSVLTLSVVALCGDHLFGHLTASPSHEAQKYGQL